MQLSEITIQRKIKNGDISAFETLFKTWYVPLCNFAGKYFSDRDTAEEIVQEFFYNYWKNRQSISVRISLKSYLFMSVRNNCIKQHRHNTVRQRYAESTMNEQETHSVDAPLQERELQKIIQRVLDQLPLRCSQIFRMSRYEGKKYKEIAQELNVSVKTVEANMGKALQALRENLKNYTDYAF
jgi:RNA polymerase sigma-70 factor, ECF subfamily